MDEAADSLAVAEQQVAVLFESAEVNDSRDDQQLRFEHGLVPSELIPVATTVAGHFEKLATGRWKTISRGWISPRWKPGTSM
jgi:ATP-dependent DNA helicase DinG